jgi:hypothetical protein
MQCPQCLVDISPHFVNCPHCEAPLGFPNVRAACTAVERSALDARYNTARQHAQINGSSAVLDAFEASVKNSKAVICYRWGTVFNITESGSELFKTFYRQLDDGNRLPEDNEFDQARQSIDANLFPYYFGLIHFAALTLDKSGPQSYGECAFIFREKSISHRTSVFEENTLVFCKKNAVPAGQSPPPGFRASWDDRHRLAAAKLHQEIGPTTPPVDFAGIFLKQKGGRAADEFIEAHVYGMLDVKAVERFVAPKPTNKADQTLASRFKRKLKSAGAEID